MRKYLYVALPLLIASAPSMAQNKKKVTVKEAAAPEVPASTPESIPVQPSSPVVNEKDKTDEADQVITNRRLRADAGSLSKWSANMFFNYQGGSLADPIKADRPNILNGADSLTLQNFSGDVGLRYRITALDSITASAGLFMTTPFHDKLDTKNAALKKNFDENSQKLTVNDPSVRFTHLDKFLGLQSVSYFKPTLITNNQQKGAGYQSSFLASQTFMKDVGNTGFSYGAGFQLLWYTFNNDNQNLTNFQPGFFPAAEYVINDTFNLRTVFGFQNYEQRRYHDKYTYIKRKVYQSVGLGISVSRDVFLYPNIQYIPSDIRSDRTNLAISANINMF